MLRLLAACTDSVAFGGVLVLVGERIISGSFHEGTWIFSRGIMDDGCLHDTNEQDLEHFHQRESLTHSQDAPIVRGHFRVVFRGLVYWELSVLEFFFFSCFAMDDTKYTMFHVKGYRFATEKVGMHISSSRE